VTGRWSASVSRDTTRLVAFSDGVFAITITLLVLGIKPPSDESNLLHDLLALWPSALAFNAVWQYASRHRLLSAALDRAGATAIGRRFQLALAWLATGALLGAVVPVLGVAVIVAFNVFYRLPIAGESPGGPEGTAPRT
jgi:transmembrane protein TMEM174 (potassium channel)